MAHRCSSGRMACRIPVHRILWNIAGNQIRFADPLLWNIGVRFGPDRTGTGNLKDDHDQPSPAKRLESDTAIICQPAFDR